MKATNSARYLLAASVLALFASAFASADIVYSDNFDSGSSSFTAASSYWTNQSLCNGYIIKTTYTDSVCGGAFTSIYISYDASGSGYFLFEGTAGNATDTGFYISPEFTVTPDTTYTISFDMTNADTSNPAYIRPDINGTLLGSAAIGAQDQFSNGYGWQPFSFSWTSDSSTTSAVLTLNDETLGGVGNDFGIDDVQVATSSNPSTPEPGTGSLLCAAFGISAVIGALGRRKKAASNGAIRA